MSLERSYSDNELRIRGLIDELSSQREAIINNADRVGSSLGAAKEDLSKDIVAIGDKVTANLTGIADGVRTIGDDISTSISDKTSQMTIELGMAGETLVSSLNRESEHMLERLNTSGSETVDQLTKICLLYTSPSPRDQRGSRMPSSA